CRIRGPFRSSPQRAAAKQRMPQGNDSGRYVSASTRNSFISAPPFSTMIHTLWPEVNNALRRGAEAASSLSDEKTGHPKLGVLFHSGAGNEAR
ncbi:hypothetical protein AJOOGB_AJOOGB_14810, partial [Dysosmobacter welbionis]